MNSFVLLAYASLAASRTLLQRLIACLNFTLESEDFYFLFGTSEKHDFMNYGSSTSSCKPWKWMRLDLMFSMWYIYTSIPTWTHSQNSVAAAEAPSIYSYIIQHLFSYRSTSFYRQHSKITYKSCMSVHLEVTGIYILWQTSSTNSRNS